MAYKGRLSICMKGATMPRTIAADTFNRWWAALDERARAEADISPSEQNPAGERLNAMAAMSWLEACASPTSLDHDGLHSDGQWVRRGTAASDTVVLEQSGETGDEFIAELIKNIVALTGIEPEYVDEPVPGNDIDPMVERMREAREARDK